MSDTSIKRVDTINERADTLFYQDITKSLKHAQNAESIARAISYQQGLATALYHQVRCYHSLADYYFALKVADECAKILNKTNDLTTHIQILKRLVTIYSELGDFKKGLELLLKAISLARSINDQEEEAELIFRMGIQYSLQGDHQEAIDNYQYCIRLFKTFGDTLNIAKAYNSCCVDLVYLEEFESAKRYGQKAIEVFNNIDHTFGVGVATSSLGEVFLAEKNYEKAKDCFEQAINLCSIKQEVLTTSEGNETLLNLGKAHLGLNNISKALEYGYLVLEHAEKTDSQPMKMSCHQFISIAHEKNGGAEKALHHLKKYIKIQKSLLNKGKSREIANLQVLHKTNEALAETEHQKKLRENDRKNYERVSQIKDDFLNNATHDIKNPLLIINTSTHLLRRQFLEGDKRFQKYLNQIDQQSKRILHLVQDILDLAKLEATPAVHSEMQHFEPFINELFHHFEPLAEAKNIDLSWEISPLNLSFRFNKQRLSQSLENLISNSIKYTPKGGKVHLSSRIVDTYLQIAVKDTGVGIPKSAIPNLFNRFYRAPNNTEMVEGTGLGLSITKLIIEQHGGTIQVDSELDKGSTFTINIPLSEN